MKSSVVGAGALALPGMALVSCGGGDKLVPLKAEGEYYLPTLPDKAADGRELKVGLVGCGGRGSGAIQDMLSAANGITVVALGDVFEDRLSGTKKMLAEKYNQVVADGNCFIGFDAYKQVIDAGVDVVLLCTPPAFRPEQFKYATEKSVHSFLEKPVAVDSEGFRSVVATARQATAKGLSVVTGTQRHHQRPYLASLQKIMEGTIGEIRGGNVYWNQNQLWYRTKQQGWSDMEWMIRDWVNWTWLSGDEIIEQHVHNIDVFMWMTGLKPLKATGVGSRQRRVTGDGYDNFSIDFEFENGIHLHSMCRQIDGCSNYVGEIINGTKGVWYNNGDEPYITDLAGNEIWRYDKAGAEVEFAQMNPYVLEHVNLVNCIRSNTPLNQAEECANSTMAGIMGRDAAYTGATVSWEEASAKTHGFMPELVMADMDMTRFSVPVPGTGK